MILATVQQNTETHYLQKKSRSSETTSKKRKKTQMMVGETMTEDCNSDITTCYSKDVGECAELCCTNTTGKNKASHKQKQ